MQDNIRRISLKFPAQPGQRKMLGIGIARKGLDMMSLLRQKRPQAIG
jgi:hypothetical protein